jgi:NAD(P)-dependent dehydrogenase (short-subunit alcohol dehydrogenase family)
MVPPPDPDGGYRAAGKLEGKVAVVTGGDSGIGRAVCLAYAKEGADVAVVYLDEHEDAAETARLVEAEGRRCLTLAGDVGDPAFCRRAIEEAVRTLGRIDVLVNNAAEQHQHERLEDVPAEEVERTFRTNIFSMFWMTQAALPHLGPDSTIVNTTSVTAYRGSPSLIPYAATKGAIVAFTRSLAESLAKRRIRVNAVAPGPIWTPLIPASFPAEKVETFGSDVPLGRAGQPAEVAPSYVFLASADSSYMTGQVLHPNGGEIING